MIFSKVKYKAIQLRNKYIQYTSTMKNLHFQVKYRAEWGQHLSVHLMLGGAEAPSLPLITNDGYTWHGSTLLSELVDEICYRYEVRDGSDKLIRREEGTPRCFHPRLRSSIVFCDTWRTAGLSPVMERSAFVDCIMKSRGGEALHEAPISGAALLLLRAAPPPKGWRWAVVGNTVGLGNWHPERACYLQRTNTYEWGIAMQREDFAAEVEYKFIWVNEHDVSMAIWETGENRCLPRPVHDQSTAIVHTDEAPDMGRKAWRGAGVVIPVFSLRSEGSMGCGDFGDLKEFIRWAASVGMQAVQLLPINDTATSGTWRDSYPYNSVSVFALHPIYIDPREWKTSRAYKKLEKVGCELNERTEMDYEGTYSAKMKFLYELFAEKGPGIIASANFKAFVRDEAEWLQPYATFCRRRDLFHTANFRCWPEESAKVAECQENKNETFYCFVQYLLHRQMKEVKHQADEEGVILKGDIPIGISPDSVEAFTHPTLFHFNGQAGAPPDAFAINGQNWGFPTYNWENMAKDNYAWWRARLNHMSRYFHAYRIDHVLGFFRIWEIPSSQIHGILGHFRPARPLSEEEIRNFGFKADIDSFTRASVSPEVLERLSDEVGGCGLKRFFQREGSRYVLRSEVSTQRAIEQRVNQGVLRETLLKIATEVLFLVDPDHPNRYHPRIAAQLTHAFNSLSEKDRQAFTALHDYFFYHRHNKFWADEAMKKLPVVTRSTPGDFGGMLPCAEDLGMVPASVKGVLEELQILSLEIQTMPKTYGVRFGDLASYPYLSVATIATHDMPPLRLWWKQNPEAASAYWHGVMHRSTNAPVEATTELCEQIVMAHLDSPSMLCLLALQDYLAINKELRSSHPEKEQINIPANPNQYWRYRIHLTIEQLISATGFNEQLRALIERSGRGR